MTFTCSYMSLPLVALVLLSSSQVIKVALKALPGHFPNLQAAAIITYRQPPAEGGAGGERGEDGVALPVDEESSMCACSERREQGK